MGSSGANNATSMTAQRLAAAGTDAFSVGVTSDTVDRFVINADGSLEWGPGNAAADSFLARTGVRALELSGSGGGGLTLRCAGQFQLQSTNNTMYLADAAGVGVVSFASGAMTFAEAKNVVLGTTTGTKIGTGTTQKLGFFNATPVVQRGAITSPTAPGAVYVQAEAAAMKTAVDAIIAALQTLGLTA